MGKYRSKLQIIADVLSVVRGGAKKTQIMYQANLSYKLLTQYLADVIKAGLVSFDDADCYRLTSKGQEFLAMFGEYCKSLEQLEEHFNNVNDREMILKKMIATNLSRRSDKDE